jgi:glucose-6-phosphate dehydrogenase assembly protein OpcA
MPAAYKVLGQSNPTANTDTTLYTVPAATSAVVSSITVCNTTSSAITYRVAVRIAGATLATAQYIAYDATVGANDTAILTLGLSLAATDIITIRSSATNVAFHAYGTEIT